jgi:hypothetical protein
MGDRQLGDAKGDMIEHRRLACARVAVRVFRVCLGRDLAVLEKLVELSFCLDRSTAAVGCNGRAGDVARARRGEEGDDLRDLLGL